MTSASVLPSQRDGLSEQEQEIFTSTRPLHPRISNACPCQWLASARLFVTGSQRRSRYIGPWLDDHPGPPFVLYFPAQFCPHIRGHFGLAVHSPAMDMPGLLPSPLHIPGSHSISRWPLVGSVSAFTPMPTVPMPLVPTLRSLCIRSGSSAGLDLYRHTRRIRFLSKSGSRFSCRYNPRIRHIVFLTVTPSLPIAPVSPPWSSPRMPPPSFLASTLVSSSLPFLSARYLVSPGPGSDAAFFFLSHLPPSLVTYPLSRVPISFPPFTPIHPLLPLTTGQTVAPPFAPPSS